MDQLPHGAETTPEVVPTTPRELKAASQLANAIDLAYNHPWKLAFRAFTQGMMSAIGAACGTILIIAVSGYVANQLGLFTTLLDKFQNALASTQRKVVQEVEQPTPSPTPTSVPLP